MRNPKIEAETHGRPATEPPSKPFHCRTPEETLAALATSEDGLSSAEAEKRCARYGRNHLPAAERRSAIVRFLHQFDNLLVYVLLAAATVVMEIFYLFSIRYVQGTSLTWRGVLGTPAVLLGVAAAAAAQFAFTYLAPMQAVFESRSLGFDEGVVIVTVGVVLLLVVELEKYLSRRITRSIKALRSRHLA